ncbi:MAG TPA: HlyD family secretion protein [Rhizomicrobium sp.]|jgi:membrane fusion protein (multidrug efflux system)
MASEDSGRGDRERQNSGEKPARDAEKRRSVFQRPVIVISIVVILAAIIIGGIIFWLIARQYEDTDDAFIDTHIVQLAPQISGRVSRVLVYDNELVHRGQILVEIDPADQTARLDQMLAQEHQAETQLGQAEAQVHVSQAAYDQALASTKGAAAQSANAASDLARYRKLKATNPLAVAQQQLDSAAATAHNLAATLDASRQQVQGAKSQIAAAEAAVAGADATVRSLQAQVAQARLSLGYTRIVAPLDGHVAQRSVADGNYVQTGEQLMAIVPLRVWVTANFKETQLAHMRPGQSVDIAIDACPSADVTGHVDSIQRGAGQAFGILPPENATGNYVKVVQRVPVKILIDRVPSDCVVGPGMSVEPSVKVR